MRNVKIVVQYDGTGYVGWQRQATGESIQEHLESVLERIEGSPVRVHGAGRTDAGVHALAQVASVHLASTLDEATLARALNANLPPAIRVTGVTVEADGFHARFSATSKTYEYRIWNGEVVPPFIRLYAWHIGPPLAVDRMQRAADDLVGEHDFAAFRGANSVVHATVRTITMARWRPAGPDAPLLFEISADGFLRHMVRSLVGTLVEIGRGWRDVSHVRRLLETGDRDGAGRTAPACGLFLVRVDY
jgi:tRNA pseudouridine38-40 synthase